MSVLPVTESRFTPRPAPTATGRAQIATPGGRIYGSAALESLLVSKSEEADWDWREFRDVAYEFANARNLKSPAQISRAMGEKTDSKVSRWFRGEARPTQAGVQQICDATGAPYPRMMWLSGNDPLNKLGGAEAEPVREQIPVVVGEITAMFSPSSPLSEQSRTDLERDLNRWIESYRKEMHARRKPA